jgi:FSR family fosmidomycin resistance protein-like MFS transporter
VDDDSYDRPRRGVDRRGMTVISSGHALADCCQGAVPALLPYLIAARGWSYATASALVLAATLSSSVVQPVFGIWADRRSLSWLMPVGILLAGVGVGLAAVAPTYGLVLLAVLVSGFGVAAFHPEGSRYANYLSGARRATGMSLFSVGGNAGFALGPVVITAGIAAFGLSGSLVIALPAALVAVWVLRELPRLHRFRPRGGPQSPGGQSAADRVLDDWPAFGRLAAVITARTFVFFGLITFVPLYYADVLHTSNTMGNAALTIFLVGGACGTLLGGPLADRFGRRPVVVGALALLPPIVLVFRFAPEAVATPLLFLAGACVVSTFSVTVVMGQEYLPTRIGLASGVTQGLSIGLGGVGASLLGFVADARGLPFTLDVIAALPLIGVAIALTLPSRRGPAAAPRA